MASGRPISSLILTELYEARQDDFVDQLLAVTDGRSVKGLIERWKKETSPFATRSKLRFIAASSSEPTHRLVVKRLFKHADLTGDEEVMAGCLYRFDQLVRRKRHTRLDWSTREQTEVLKATSAASDEGLFPTNATRHYVRRRAWRHYRRLGFRQPAAYVPAVCLALKLYQDTDISTGLALLDNWGLVHALFGKSPLLVFSSRHTNVRLGQPLSALAPAPMFERLWAAPGAADLLFDLILKASSRTVRVWAIAILRRHHAARLATINADTLLALVEHTDVDVAVFAAELLADARVAAAFPVTTWLRLAGATNPTVIVAIVDAFRKHVAFDRLSATDAVDLATRQSVPAAALGMDIIESRPLKSADLPAVARLAAARAAAIAPRIARFAVPALNQPGRYNRDEVVGFFDSYLLPLRTAAFTVLQPQSPADTDPAFWAALLESPYDDIRAALVAALQRRATLPGTGLAAHTRLWASVLLNIHRGGRAKLTALRQLSAAIAANPSESSQLLSILAIALRSVRAPEARHALSALVMAAESSPATAAEIGRLFPELKLEVPA